MLIYLRKHNNCSRASRAGSALPVADAINNNNRRLLESTLPAHAQRCFRRGVSSAQQSLTVAATQPPPG